MQLASLLLVAGVALAQYDTQPSGYGNNNPGQVQYVAGKSPRNKPVDYTKGSNDFPGGGFNVIGNKFKQQNLGQTNFQGQQNFQKGGDQANVGVNTNAVNVGQTNNQQGGGGRPPGYRPYSDAPAYGGNPAPYNPFNFVGNNVYGQNLGQTSNQGQANVQQGGAQTNYGQNQNAVNVGQTNNQGGNGNYGGNSGYRPSYDAPAYGGQPSSYGAVLIPINPSYGPGSLVKGNNFDLQNLGQTSNQGQSNAQVGGAQTNLGANANTVNVGQSNNQGGSAGYGKPSYDAPRYGGNVGYTGGADINNFIKNNVYSQNLGQTNAQGQTNVQQGGDQANVGINTNAVNVGQTNNQGGAGPYKGYDAPRYGGYNPGNVFAGNKVYAQNLGQTSNQGQSNAQIGGAQTNAGYNANAVNVGQTNNQGGSGNRGYDAPKGKYAVAPPAYKPDTQETGGYKSRRH
ncbi:hypothetical protein Q1695_007663 [Nippostrongylus brasiliensis]|nr:hypothetical protein Q1695_007663 [Nippostrongylus brasiliensis]